MLANIRRDAGLDNIGLIGKTVIAIIIYNMAAYTHEAIKQSCKDNTDSYGAELTCTILGGTVAGVAEIAGLNGLFYGAGAFICPSFIFSGQTVALEEIGVR